jgi:hypothetical protein
MPSIPAARQNGVPENRIVRSDWCKALDYLLVRIGLAGPPASDEYHALFTGPSSDEVINPVTGYPRPEPDAAVKTKGHRIAPNLLLPYPLRKPASRFSGKMREVVGCYHARGLNAPFDHGAQVTHGIYTGLVPKEGGGTEAAYWLIEVAGGLGVFAARLTVIKDGLGAEVCCGSWSVEHLKPTAEEVKAGAPAMFRDERVSLWWIWQNRGGSVVQRVLNAEQIAPGFANGGPWYSEHGWAFSASGREAQQVVQGFGTIDGSIDCLTGSRFKITLTNEGTRVVGSFSTVELGQRYTLMIDRTVWVPTVPGTWQGTIGPGVATLGNPLQKLPNQDAPIFVYYVGEVEQVVRWQLSYSATDEVDERKSFDTGGTFIAPGHECIAPVVKNAIPTGTSGTKTGADNIVVCGFEGAGISEVGTNQGPRNDAFEEGFVGGAEETASDVSVSNTFSLNPECFYFHDFGPPIGVSEVHGCIQPVRARTFSKEKWQKFETYSFSESWKASVVLFMEEREAVLSVRAHGVTRSGSGSTTHGTKFLARETSELQAGQTMNPPDCPPNIWDYEFGGGDLGSSTTDHSSTYSIDESTFDAQAVLSLGGFNVVVSLPETGPPFHDISDFNFGTFLECRNGPPLKDTAESVVACMKGNTGDTHRYYHLSTVVVTTFPYTSGEPVAFIGKA